MPNDHDSNPMHAIGHGRGDDGQPVPRKTAAYSFIDQEHVAKKSDSLIPEMKVLTVRDVISDLIEQDLLAWKALPKSVQNALMERPADFQFITTQPNMGSPGGTPITEFRINILYNGTVWRWAPNFGVWAIHEIVR